jgi:phage protein D
MTRRTRVFEDVDDAEVVRRIASDHGLSPSVELSGPTHKVLAQVNQSDLAFLRDRARSLGFEVWVDGTTLNAKERAARGATSFQLGLGNTLREFTVLADLAHQRSSVTVSGWDVTGKEAIKYEATDSVIRGELDGGTSGPSLLASALKERKEHIAHGVPLGSKEAEHRAQAHFKAIARRFVVGRGVAETDARLRVGAVVELGGVGPLFEGKYRISEVRHVFDGDRGVRSEFVVERPAIGQAR